MRAAVSSNRGACRTLVSTSSEPPGASHGNAPSITRRSTSSPSVPPSSAIRGSYTRASGQQPDRLGGYVRRVGDQDVDPTSQRSGQRLVQVAFVDVAADGGDVAAGAPYGGGVDVDGVQLDGFHYGGQRSAYRARTATQVDDDRPCRSERYGLVDQELGAPARYEDPGVHRYPLAAELRPAQYVFQRQPGDSPVHHLDQAGRRTGGGDEQPRLVFGEDTSGGAESGDDRGSEGRCWRN